MPTKRQADNFAELIKEDVEVKSQSLETAIAWIQENLTIDDVFTKDQIGEWLNDEGYTKD